MRTSGTRWVRRLGRALLVACQLLLVAYVCASTTTAATIDDDVRRIAKQLRCPICESVSVADSPAELAVQMRGVIRAKLEAGQSEQEILDYFVAAYGDSVLLEPPRRGLGWAAWLVPAVVVLVGAMLLAVVLRGWLRPTRRDRPADPSRNGPGPSDADVSLAAARAELESVRRSIGP